MILDNLPDPQDPQVHRWLLRHRRFHFHFTPTYGSWMNLVERWFSALTTKKLKRSAHRNVKELAADILDWAATWNENPRPSCGPRSPSRSSNDSPATAPPSTLAHDTSFQALQLSGTLGPSQGVQCSGQRRHFRKHRPVVLGGSTNRIRDIVHGGFTEQVLVTSSGTDFLQPRVHRL